jgi:SAM-dependent methyltransferase
VTVLRGAGPVGPDDERGVADGYDTRWLDLRAAADARSRSATLLRLLADLVTAGAGSAGPSGPRPRPPHLVDVGCGAGAMQRWCAEQLPAGTRWTLVDPDAGLLDIAAARALIPVRTVVGTVADLPGVLGATNGERVDAAVCSALLDVLRPEEVEHLVAEVAGAGVPLLASLTVTGRVSLDPAHPLDEPALRAVHRTATATGAAGPAALDGLRDAARRHRLDLVEDTTSWHLDAVDDATLVRAWADGYVAAALAGSPAGVEDELASWAAQRRDEVRSDRLAVVVEHVDVLVGAGSGHVGLRPGLGGAGRG